MTSGIPNAEDMDNRSVVNVSGVLPSWWRTVPVSWSASANMGHHGRIYAEFWQLTLGQLSFAD